jgi:hypothetical protein
MQLAPHIRALHKILDQVYNASDDLGWNWHDLAEQSGLHKNTVWLHGHRMINYPQFRTVFLLAKAVGLELMVAALQKKAKKKSA